MYFFLNSLYLLLLTYLERRHCLSKLLKILFSANISWFTHSAFGRIFNSLVFIGLCISIYYEIIELYLVCKFSNSSNVAARVILGKWELTSWGNDSISIFLYSSKYTRLLVVLFVLHLYQMLFPCDPRNNLQHLN